MRKRECETLRSAIASTCMEGFFVIGQTEYNGLR